jgi:hypothetical protein
MQYVLPVEGLHGAEAGARILQVWLCVCRTRGDGAVCAPRGGDGAEAGALVLHGACLARALCQVCPAGRVHPSGARHQVKIKKISDFGPKRKSLLEIN